MRKTSLLILCFVMLISLSAMVPANAATIRIAADAPGEPISPRLLGSNMYLRLDPALLHDPLIQQRTAALGIDFYRLPGGSLSNSYNWLGCETGDPLACPPPALRPTDFINFLRPLDPEIMWTISANATPEEAVALAAFFNAEVDDPTPIGVDRRGRDWHTAGHWARLRSKHGNPAPLRVAYWEFGNELYGGREGRDCDPQWGWEDVWTCDGREYVAGIGTGAAGHDGLLAYRDALLAFDPSLQIGAVGVAAQTAYNNWGNEVLDAAGGQIDFYAVHPYPYFRAPTDYAEALARPQLVVNRYLVEDVAAGLEQRGLGDQVAIAINEYNFYSDPFTDDALLLNSALNALFTADLIGQMAQAGIPLANHWLLFAETAPNGNDYGVIGRYSRRPQPTYFAFRLWKKFGTTLLPVSSQLPVESTLSLYAGRGEAGLLTVLAINKTDAPITTMLEFKGVEQFVSGSVEIVQAERLEDYSVSYNGVNDPNPTLSNAPALRFEPVAGVFEYSFAPYSITLLRLVTEIQRCSDHCVYLPVAAYWPTW